MQISLAEFADARITHLVYSGDRLQTPPVIACQLADRAGQESEQRRAAARGCNQAVFRGKRHVTVVTGPHIGESHPGGGTVMHASRPEQRLGGQLAQRRFPRSGMGPSEMMARLRRVSQPEGDQTEVVLTECGERRVALERLEFTARRPIAPQPEIYGTQVVAELRRADAMTAGAQEIRQCLRVLAGAERRDTQPEFLRALCRGNTGGATACRPNSPQHDADHQYQAGYCAHACSLAKRPRYPASESPYCTSRFHAGRPVLWLGG